MTIPINRISANQIIGPVAGWGLLQLVILGVGASGFPLWAHHPFPRESAAFSEMLCGQIIVLSMLCPVLLRSGWALAINLLTVVPFEELSGLLSHTPQAEIARGECCIMLWMIGLAGCACRLKGERRQMWLVTLAMLFTLGGVVLDYVRWEAWLAGSQPAPFSPAGLLPRLCIATGLNSILTWWEATAPAMIFATVVFITNLLPRGTQPQRGKAISSAKHRND